MTDARRSLGARGEQLARDYLEGLGYQVLATNQRTARGEVDIVALEGGCLVFVEVRTRRGDSLGTPEESVGPRKARRLIALAETYADEHPELPADLRIDVVPVVFDRRGRLQRIEVIQNAVSN